MIPTQETLYDLLKTAQIEYALYEHAPVFTAEEGIEITKDIPGPHVKNLFLRDKKKTTYVLLTIKEHKRVDLMSLSQRLDLGRLSFASSNDLVAMLNVTPGSVTPVAILNDERKRVMLYFDDDLLKDEYICIHPMINNATIRLKLNDLLGLISSHHHQPQFISIPEN